MQERRKMDTALAFVRRLSQGECWLRCRQACERSAIIINGSSDGDGDGRHIECRVPSEVSDAAAIHLSSNLKGEVLHTSCICALGEQTCLEAETLSETLPSQAQDTMLDESFPAFFLKASSTGIKHHRDLYLSHRGSPPEPAYHLQHADPASPSAAHKNCYAAALFDAYNPDVLFGEVLARPAWTHPTLSADEVKRHGAVPPPPQPVLPTDFSIQLYNPDQQVRVEVKSGVFASDSYEFSMPQDVFRTPSNSTLDRGQSDPASLDVTPRINFVWRKESKLGKDLTCFMTGKSTDQKKKSSKKDPDIAIGLWRSMRELTIYEPNLGRIDLEDPKGLEVVLLLSAIVIKDLYFSTKDQLPDLFNISDGAARKLSSGGRKLSNPKSTYALAGAPNPLSSHPPTAQQQQQESSTTPNEIKRNSLPKLQTTPQQPSARPATSSKPPPLADPRSQWELEAETARLKAEQDAEARAAAHQRREREKADEAERKRLQRMVEAEEKEAKRKQAEIDKETDRLRKLYGVKPVPQQPNTSAQYLQPGPPQQPPRPRPRPAVVGSNGLYVQPSASASSVMMSGGNATASSSLNVPGGPGPGMRPTKKKSSFFGLRSVSDDAGPGNGERLRKKGSTMW